MKYNVALLLLVVSMNLYSQQVTYTNGIILTPSGDTIYCRVPLTSSFGDKVRIKKGFESNEEVVLPLDSIKFLGNGSNVYEHVVYKKGDKEIHKLMWLEIEGKINLYKEMELNLKSANSTGAFKGGGSYITTYAVRKDNITYFVDNNNFKEVITTLVSENEELLHKIQADEYKIGNLEKLIQQYNEAAEKQ